MAEGFKIEIVSPGHLVLSEQAQAVSVPGQEGYFTVMADHAPLMTTLKPGFVTVSGTGGARTFYVRGGFADVSAEGLTILAEEARTGADFSRTEIETAIHAAREAVGRAESPEAKNLAQATLDGWLNLMMEAAHQGGAVQI